MGRGRSVIGEVLDNSILGEYTHIYNKVAGSGSGR